MSKALKAVEQLQRPPLSSVADRLRLLADELPDGCTSAIVVLNPGNEVYGFGQIDCKVKSAGFLLKAALFMSADD
jgi:hypothetical protein